MLTTVQNNFEIRQVLFIHKLEINVYKFISEKVEDKPFLGLEIIYGINSSFPKFFIEKNISQKDLYVS